MNNKEEIALRKLELVMKTSKIMDALEELEAAAFEVLQLHPGCDFTKWATILVQQYGTELIDAYGTEAKKIHASIIDLWQHKYRDEASGLTRTFETWAKVFATEEAVNAYLESNEIR